MLEQFGFLATKELTAGRRVTKYGHSLKENVRKRWYK
jgi:hypothetical protein